MSQSQSDQFRQYAEEAMLSASKSKNDPEIKALTDLANVWALAVLQERARRRCARSVDRMTSAS